ncbi:hypothetical protein DPMN_005357 [Dreissena polymorpha]|uniref:Uncharacterized protein n=1 Tax=Dreissena polymorpha TaxID=45954 RepID=A0A9D4RTU0_DREPO|nr:hypothetical protein DPMN_005357 [Dreissena polymorpha]
MKAPKFWTKLENTQRSLFTPTVTRGKDLVATYLYQKRPETAGLIINLKTNLPFRAMGLKSDNDYIKGILDSALIPQTIPKEFWTLSRSSSARTNILTKFHEDLMKILTSIINILTNFHKDWMKTVTSTVYTNKIINILTKFHKDWMKTVTSTVYTNKLLTDGRTHAHTHTTDARHHTVT